MTATTGAATSDNGIKTAPRIMEVTLRDGSYVINFQFTAADTRQIAGSLQAAGFDLIEVGHGVGMRAAEAGMGDSAATDAEYLEAASSVLDTAEFGMFLIPGIAKLEDIDLLASSGASFVRIGTNVDEVDTSEKYIERAKARGLFVSANFMKSYAMAPAEFAKAAQLTEKYGTDLLCIVDSAGGMLTHELEDYFAATQDATELSLGFHGHDNLGLANANSLRAVELGAEVIDTSLQGLGRSAGNASTDIVLALLERSGYDMGIDLLELLDISMNYVQPLVQRRGVESIDVVAGYAQFHSSFMGTINRYAGNYDVDPRRLIIELCKVDQVQAPPELVESIAKSLQGEGPGYSSRFGLHRYHGSEEEFRAGDLDQDDRAK